MIVPLLIIHGFVTVAMIGLILLQKSDSSGPLGMGGGSTNSLFTARGVANVLTRSTAFLAVLFVGNCILIGKLITRESSEFGKLMMLKAPSSSAAASGDSGDSSEEAKQKSATNNSTSDVQSSDASTQSEQSKDGAENSQNQS
ncbi:MAG: preprotein translocase subunit SecG, partial [Holosporales bacterium]|nr:preprotein translocase subunit SecG [Holosporales bacterium]